ncbi:hypothetical protein RB594_008049 [Gaeumannomyces avenae]
MVVFRSGLLVSALQICLWAIVSKEVACSYAGNTTLPQRYGFVAFRAFESLDLFGPLQVLAMLAKLHRIDVSIIAESMELVTTEPVMAAMNPTNSSIYPRIAPTHTFTNAPSDIEVLIIPGGLGTGSPNVGELVQFVKETYPRLRYLITVCTGATFAAKAGLLDGRRATTNKRSWAETTEPWAGTVRWVPRARWVEDGNVWTSSGISAGIDATLGFVAKVYGQANATHVANLMEYGWHEDPSWDPFSDVFGVLGRD